MQPASLTGVDRFNLMTFGVELDWLRFYYSLVRPPDLAQAFAYGRVNDVNRAACNSQIDPMNPAGTDVVVGPVPLRNCGPADALQWHDSLVTTASGATALRAVGFRDSAERWFKIDGTPTQEEALQLERITAHGREFGVDAGP